MVPRPAAYLNDLIYDGGDSRPTDHVEKESAPVVLIPDAIGKESLGHPSAIGQSASVRDQAILGKFHAVLFDVGGHIHFEHHPMRVLIPPDAPFRGDFLGYVPVSNAVQRDGFILEYRVSVIVQ